MVQKLTRNRMELDKYKSDKLDYSHIQMIAGGNLNGKNFVNYIKSINIIPCYNFSCRAVYQHNNSTLSISSCLISSRNLVVNACWSDNPWALSFRAFDSSSSSCILSCCKTAILFHSCSLTSCTLRSNSLFYIIIATVIWLKDERQSYHIS